MSVISNSLSLPAATAAGTVESEPSASAKATREDALANKDVFIQLLVAQLQNQNPLTPSNPIEFLTQLAQFTSLEQDLAIREELEAIRTSVEFLAQHTANVSGADGSAETEATEV